MEQPSVAILAQFSSTWMKAAHIRVHKACSKPEAQPAIKCGSAEEEYRLELIDRFARGKLDATDLASLAWKSMKAGAGGVKGSGCGSRTEGSEPYQNTPKSIGP